MTEIILFMIGILIGFLLENNRPRKVYVEFDMNVCNEHKVIYKKRCPRCSDAISMTRILTIR